MICYKHLEVKCVVRCLSQETRSKTSLEKIMPVKEIQVRNNFRRDSNTVRSEAAALSPHHQRSLSPEQRWQHWSVDTINTLTFFFFFLNLLITNLDVYKMYLANFINLWKVTQMIKIYQTFPSKFHRRRKHWSAAHQSGVDQSPAETSYEWRWSIIILHLWHSLY